MPIAGTCAGRRRVRRAGARQPGDGGRHAAQGAPSSPGIRLERLLHRRAYRLPPRLVVRDTGRPSLRHHQQRRQRRNRRRAGRIQLSPLLGAVVRRRSRSDLSELSSVQPRCRQVRDSALRPRRALGLFRHRARPRWLYQRALAGLRHRWFRVGRRTVSQYADGVDVEEKHHQRPPGLGSGRWTGIRLRAALERKA